MYTVYHAFDALNAALTSIFTRVSPEATRYPRQEDEAHFRMRTFDIRFKKLQN